MWLMRSILRYGFPVATDKQDVTRSTGQLIRKIYVGCNLAVHAIVLETWDGTRFGTILDDEGREMPITDRSLRERCEAHDKYNSVINLEWGDHIVRMSGRDVRSETGVPDLLCHSIAIKLASGRTFSHVGEHTGWMRTTYDVCVTDKQTSPNLVISIARTHPPQFECMRTAIHHPLSSDTYWMLPADTQRHVVHLWWVFSKINRTRAASEQMCLPHDVWGRLLGCLRGFHLVVTASNGFLLGAGEAYKLASGRFEGRDDFGREVRGSSSSSDSAESDAE